ncbi:MAG: RNA polymerase subunit sigma-70, partial [Gemmatimonadetes bacterium]|nr:RNA polymerase subunit sigma-70 [Gemmatimonadota bacterium]
MQRAAAGDSAAFGLLVEEHTPWLLVRRTRRVGSDEVADLVLQEAVIAAYPEL